MSEDENIEQNPEDGKTESREENLRGNISLQETIEQPKTTNPKSEIQKSDIQNMEVHHHPHVKKKNFKEYFLEFVMIFLAVTLGFIEENVRKPVSDNTKEKYILSTKNHQLTSSHKQTKT